MIFFVLLCHQILDQSDYAMRMNEAIKNGEVEEIRLLLSEKKLKTTEIDMLILDAHKLMNTDAKQEILELLERKRRDLELQAQPKQPMGLPYFDYRYDYESSVGGLPNDNYSYYGGYELYSDEPGGRVYYDGDTNTEPGYQEEIISDNQLPSQDTDPISIDPGADQLGELGQEHTRPDVSWELPV